MKKIIWRYMVNDLYFRCRQRHHTLNRNETLSWLGGERALNSPGFGYNTKRKTERGGEEEREQEWEISVLSPFLSHDDPVEDTWMVYYTWTHNSSVNFQWIDTARVHRSYTSGGSKWTSSRGRPGRRSYSQLQATTPSNYISILNSTI